MVSIWLTRPGKTFDKLESPPAGTARGLPIRAVTCPSIACSPGMGLPNPDLSRTGGGIPHPDMD